jgi:adenine-specific DNA-methyltransferase
MGVNISYMGTKRQLAPAVAAAIGSAKPGILLDAFSGMCSVGEEVGVTRTVWTNDAQVFASEVGAALFTARHAPLRPDEISDRLYETFRNCRAKLRRKYAEALKCEEAVLSGSEFKALGRYTKLSKIIAQGASWSKNSIRVFPGAQRSFLNPARLLR